VVEQQAPIIAFVWRPEEIIPAVTQMAHRTVAGYLRCFHAGVEALRPFLRKTGPCRPRAGYQDFCFYLDDPALGHGCRRPGSKISG